MLSKYRVSISILRGSLTPRARALPQCPNVRWGSTWKSSEAVSLCQCQPGQNQNALALGSPRSRNSKTLLGADGTVRSDAGFGGHRLRLILRPLSTRSESEEKEVDEKKSATENVTSSSGEAVSRRTKLKQAVKDYGSTVLVFHITMSLCSLGMFYLLVSSGLDMVALLGNLGIGEKILESKITQGASTFVVAYAVHKVFAPVRITITLTATPLIVKKLRSIGVLKVPKSK